MLICSRGGVCDLMAWTAWEQKTMVLVLSAKAIMTRLVSSKKERHLAEFSLGHVCVCVCSDIRVGVNGSPGSQPLFMVDGCQFSVWGWGGGKEEGELKEKRTEECKKWSGGCQTWQLLRGPDKYKPLLIGWKWKIPEWRAVFSFLSASRQRWPCLGGIDFQLCLRAPQYHGFDFIFNLFQLRSLDLWSNAYWIC